MPDTRRLAAEDVMGYPMTWRRVLGRNRIPNGYDWQVGELGSLLGGDMRRLAEDSRDDKHLAYYAAVAGITTEQAKALLDAFFASDNQPWVPGRRNDETP